MMDGQKWETVQLAGNLEAKQVMVKTIPPLITTTHHDGGLPSPLSYTLVDDNPSLPSMPTKSRQNLRERRQFQNDGWTKWEAVQLADKSEAKQAMEKADWECWKKLEKRFEQFHGLFLFDLVDDNQEDARQTVTAWTRDGYVALLLPLSLPSTAQVLHQDICSKEMEGEKEEKDRENRKL
jgi:hypothetical protein